MNENRNLISMRQRRMIRQLNREIQARKERRSVARKVFAVIMTVCAVILGLLIMVGAAEIRAAEEAQAAVLRRHRITSQNITAQYPHSPNAGLQAEDPYMVESLPAEAPDHGEPPEAIEVVSKGEITTAEALPEERWESMGVWKLTAYCPCEVQRPGTRLENGVRRSHGGGQDSSRRRPAVRNGTDDKRPDLCGRGSRCAWQSCGYPSRKPCRGEKIRNPESGGIH